MWITGTGRPTTGAFLVANSWGTNWGVTNSSGAGTKGFFWVAYKMFSEATFGPTVYYADDRPHYRPKLYVAAGINHPSRDALRLRGKITGSRPGTRRKSFTTTEGRSRWRTPAGS